MMKTFIIIILVIFFVAPIILVFRYLYDQIEATLQRTKEKIKSMIPFWIRGK
jgi:hypothetical protein